MRELDATSILVATAIGAAIFVLFGLGRSGQDGDTSTEAMIGAAVGAGVQVGVRMLGVS